MIETGKAIFIALLAFSIGWGLRWRAARWGLRSQIIRYGTFLIDDMLIREDLRSPRLISKREREEP